LTTAAEHAERLRDGSWPADALTTFLTGFLGEARVAVEPIVSAATLLVRSFANDGKVLIFGNGGSAACAQHFAAEFVGRMLLDRAPLPAIALTADPIIVTAIANDYGFEQVFARQVRALGRPGDVAIAISTSGRSPNVLAGVEAAREREMSTIGLVGSGPSPLRTMVDVVIAATAPGAAPAQQAHLLVQHALGASVEAVLFGGSVP
jgi:D-sedoheptulose 7-phosphate isomerase